MTDPVAGDSPEKLKSLMHELERGMLARIEELELETARARRLGLASLIGMAILLGLAVALVYVGGRQGIPGTTASVVAAREFHVRDASGAIRGSWGVAQDGALRLVLQEPGSRAGLSLTLLKGGTPGLTFTDSAGRTRAVLGLLPDETTTLTFADAAGVTRAVLGVHADGSATLVFADGGGGTRAGLGVDSRGVGTFTVSDQPRSRFDEPTQQEPTDTTR